MEGNKPNVRTRWFLKIEGNNVFHVPNEARGHVPRMHNSHQRAITRRQDKAQADPGRDKYKRR